MNTKYSSTLKVNKPELSQKFIVELLQTSFFAKQTTHLIKNSCDVMKLVNSLLKSDSVLNYKFNNNKFFIRCQLCTSHSTLTFLTRTVQII